jgi:hypothetical protein
MGHEDLQNAQGITDYLRQTLVKYRLSGDRRSADNHRNGW